MGGENRPESRSYDSSPGRGRSQFAFRIQHSGAREAGFVPDCQDAKIVPNREIGGRKQELTYKNEKREIRISQNGVAIQSSHWGEIIQGPTRDKRGNVRTALITLPRADKVAVAEFHLKAGRQINVFPSWKQRSLDAARLVLDNYEIGDCGGDLLVLDNIPAGKGAGGSSANVIAAIAAAAAAAGIWISREEVQRTAFEVEGASDPLALGSGRATAVYGSRSGEVVEWVSSPLPRMECLGFVTDPDAIVLTSGLVGRENYSADEIASFRQILRVAKRGIEARRVDLIAEAATESALLNQQRVVTRRLGDVLLIAKEAGAKGISVSHSGVVASAIFDPGTPDLASRTNWASACLRGIGAADVRPFSVSCEC